MTTSRRLAGAGTLHSRLTQALTLGGTDLEALADAEPADRRDALLSLLAVHDLHLAPIERLADAVRCQHHPAVAALRWRLEEAELDHLRQLDEGTTIPRPDGGHDDATAAVRAIAAANLVPDVYGWIAEDAAWDELLAFLAIEGGPDADFDDLVALCQVGLRGEPKLELARNYWDEMGQGTAAAVHTELHHRLVDAVAMRPVPRLEQPVEALERSMLGSLLATNRHLQPELVGALGLLELQAGPRCRKVVQGLRRLGAGDDALAFYEEHARVDPHHGKGWVDNAIAPLSAEPRWADGIVRGARWRSLVNDRFFTAMAERFVPGAVDEQRAS